MDIPTDRDITVRGTAAGRQRQKSYRPCAGTPTVQGSDDALDAFRALRAGTTRGLPVVSIVLDLGAVITPITHELLRHT